MSYGWEGEKTRLVPLDADEHFENCVRWLNDPEVTAWTLIGDLPLTRLAEREFFDRVQRGVETDVVFAVELLGDAPEHIGVGATGTIIGRPKLWGRGLGADIVRVRTRYAFEVLGLRLLLSQVLDGNTASLRALARSGYREVGRIPQRFWKRGAWRDLVLLALHRDAWCAAQGANPPA